MKFGVFKIGQRGMFALELLHVIFAEHAQAELVGFADDLRGEFFCHGDQRDFVALAAGAVNGGLDALFHLQEAFT